MNNKPKPREIYRHFKGREKLYRIIVVARDCENPEKEFVVYEQLYDAEKFPRGTIWARPLEDFCGDKEFPDGTKIKRFENVR